MANLKNLVWPDGQANASGIKSIAYFIPRADIVSFPKIPDNPSTAADEVTYDGDFELREGAVVHTIYTTQGKGKVTFEPTGEKDCKMYNNQATLSYPDISDEAKAYATGSLNSNYIYIVPHYVAGAQVRYAVLGSELFDSEVTSKGDSGDAPGSAKGLTIEVAAPDYYPLPNYIGILKLENGTLNCKTGVFTPNPTTPE